MAAGVGNPVFNLAFSDPISNNVACKGFEIVMVRHSRKVLGNHAAAPGIDLNEANRGVPRPGRRQCEAADAGTEIKVTPRRIHALVTPACGA